MDSRSKPGAAEALVKIATRGSALALAQANQVAALCRKAFPGLRFELKIIKTTGDKMQTAALADPAGASTKGLFTKELETALLEGQADLAVHSLKDLPTELPAGLTLAAVLRREDARDVLILRDARHVDRRSPDEDWRPGQPQWRGFKPGAILEDLPSGACVATSSTRRRAQLLASRPDLRVVEIRGNVPTRLRKLAEQAELDATVLAAAGLARLEYRIFPDGSLRGAEVPEGLLAVPFDATVMIPCVGQAAIGLEMREGDARLAPICARLNHANTLACVLAERAFLRTLGGGCQSPVGAHAEIRGHRIHLHAVVFADAATHRVRGSRPLREGVPLGEELARGVLEAGNPAAMPTPLS